MKNRYAWLDACLLEKPGAEKDYKAEWGWFRYRVGEKMFAAICEPGQEHGQYAGHMLLTVKCEPTLGELLRAQCPNAVKPGFYMDKRCWNSVFLDEALPEEVLRGMCDTSYRLVFERLTKKLQREILSAAEK